jgi:hypothetical protein
MENNGGRQVGQRGDRSVPEESTVGIVEKEVQSTVGNLKVRNDCVVVVGRFVIGLGFKRSGYF